MGWGPRTVKFQSACNCKYKLILRTQHVGLRMALNLWSRLQLLSNCLPLRLQK